MTAGATDARNGLCDAAGPRLEARSRLVRARPASTECDRHLSRILSQNRLSAVGNCGKYASPTRSESASDCDKIRLPRHRLAINTSPFPCPTLDHSVHVRIVRGELTNAERSLA